MLEKYDLIDNGCRLWFRRWADKKIDELNNEVKLARVGKATPYKESEEGKVRKGQEDITYLVRYMYTAYSGGYQTRQGRSREFLFDDER